MKEKDNIDNLFDRLSHQWDIEGPAFGHHDRFDKRLETRKPKFRWMPIAAAALIVAAVGLWFLVQKQDATPSGLKFASDKTHKTDSVFNSLIAYEMNRLREKQSPQNRQLIADAVKQLKVMETDYGKIKADLIKNGENQQVIAALIQNLQTQISFLQTVMERLEKYDNTKKFEDEKNS